MTDTIKIPAWEKPHRDKRPAISEKAIRSLNDIAEENERILAMGWESEYEGIDTAAILRLLTSSNLHIEDFKTEHNFFHIEIDDSLPPVDEMVPIVVPILAMLPNLIHITVRSRGDSYRFGRNYPSGITIKEDTFIVRERMRDIEAALSNFYRTKKDLESELKKLQERLGPRVIREVKGETNA